MFSIDIATWIQQNKESILSRCLEDACNCDWDMLATEDRAQLQDQLLLLYRVAYDAAQGRVTESSAELVRWAEQHQRAKGASLSDLLRLSFAIRRAFREVLIQQSGDAESVADAWKEMSLAFDRIAELLSETYIQALERTLTERLQESEYLTASLVQATEEADKALVRLRSIYDISQALGTSLTDAEETFGRLARALGTALEAQHCAIWLNDVGQPYAVGIYTETQAPMPTLPTDLEGSTFNAVLQAGRSQILTRGEELSAPDNSLVDSLHASSLLLAPFVVQEIPIGVVTLGRNATERLFDSTELTLVESVVTQAAVAVQNAGLYQEIRDLNRSLEARVQSRTRELARGKERIETLYTIGQELGTTFDLDQVLEKTLSLITKAVGAKYGLIAMTSSERNAMSLAAQVGELGLANLDTDVQSVQQPPGLIGWVLEHRKSVLIPETQHEDRWPSIFGKGSSARSLIAAPLTSGNDVYGVLLIAEDTPKAFDQDQQRLVIASAQQIAQAMKNVQLYRREQEERTKTQAMLQSIADGVIVNDTHDKVIVFNAAAEEILGTEQGDVLGESVWRLFDLFDENGRSDALTALGTLISSPTSLTGQIVETTLQISNKVISAHMAPVVTEDQQALGVVTALRDITREVQADRAKSEFVATVSHELRTPLTSIKGYTDLIHAGAVGAINEQQQRFLNIIKSNADRLTALINDLLDISRIESGRIKLNIEPHNLVDLVNEVADSLRDQIEAKGLRFELDVPDRSYEIMGDRVRLLQIVTNLVSNAYKFTDEGWIRVSLRPLKGTVRLDIADSGIGISTDDQSRMFERFWRADTPIMEGREGAGLGLAITKELVELHGGRLWVKSEIGVGSTFTVVLPTTARDLPSGILSELPAGARKILVVDDERDILALLRHHLTMQGYQVITASTGNAAISKAIEERPDLITLDVLLPDRHGFDVLRELKTHPATAHIPVIVLSVVQDENNGYRLGAVDYIAKPLDEERLLGSVSYILKRKGKILIAEDTDDTAEMLIELLTGHGYQVMHAADGYETLAIARRGHPDLILLDLRMPGMDGYEALTRLKKHAETRNIPILVMSAHAADPVQERLRLQAMGAEGFLSKPFSLDRLLEGIRRIALEASYQSEHMDEADTSVNIIGRTERQTDSAHSDGDDESQSDI